MAWPLARIGVPPDAVTLAGLAACVLASVIARTGGGWPILAAVVIGVAGMIDNLDGAVAVITGRVSRWGAVLDSVVDRCGDAVLLGVLWVLGAPAVVVVAAGFLAFLQEYTRARAAAVGVTEIEVVTVGERPARVAVIAMFTLAAGIFPAAAATRVTIAAWVSVGLALVALTQLTIALRRRLVSGSHADDDPDSDTAHEVGDDQR